MPDRVAVITGAANGIGRATSRILVADGIRVLGVDADEEALMELAGELGDALVPFIADVSQESPDHDYIAACIRRYGRVDIAFLNAGVLGPTRAMHEYPIADFDRVMAVNARGAWLGTTRAVAAMRSRGSGTIVLTSSTGGLRGSGGLGAYVASKHAVVGIMKTAAIEAGPYGVRVNAIHPGPTDTAVWSAAAPGKQTEASPQGGALPQLYRVAAPEEVAQMVRFLAGPDAGFCTGASFVIDGGLLAGPPFRIDD